jgi:dihydrofolate synthase/folylpolyglutamate synthase
MDYPEALRVLYGLQMFGANFGLETTRKLAALAGNPQEKLRFIHVAGTNGKGSTCAMLESIYRAANLRVGLYTSPHLVSFRERIQLNRHRISEADVARLVGEMQSQLKTENPTFFEFVTAMALRYFAEQRCDLVIWETGLGGRLDATNIVTPLASVITNIGFDHQQWLGDTLAKIAGEKAGIIKPGVPVVTTTEVPEALAVIEETAQRSNAQLIKVERTSRLLTAIEALPLPGEHQRLNAALAVATVNALQERIPVSHEAIRTGLEAVNWPGRFQVIQCGAQTFVLDGAHNPDGARCLRAALQQRFPSLRPALVLGVMADKDCAAICQKLAPLASRIAVVPLSSERGAKPANLASMCRLAHPQAPLATCSSLAEALETFAVEALVVVTGSLYLIGEALEILGALPPDSTNERGLNDWQPRKA